MVSQQDWNNNQPETAHNSSNQVRVDVSPTQNPTTVYSLFVFIKTNSEYCRGTEAH